MWFLMGKRKIEKIIFFINIILPSTFKHKNLSARLFLKCICFEWQILKLFNSLEKFYKDPPFSKIFQNKNE